MDRFTVFFKLAFKYEQKITKRDQLTAARPADMLAETVRKSWTTHFGTNITHDLAVFNPKIMNELKYGEKPLEIVMEKFRGQMRQKMLNAGFIDTSGDDTPMSDESQKVKMSKSASQMISKYQNQIDMNESMNGPETTSSSGFTSQLNSSLLQNFGPGQPGSSSPISNPQQQTDEIKSEIKNLTSMMMAEFGKMNENLKNQNVKVDENIKDPPP